MAGLAAGNVARPSAALPLLSVWCSQGSAQVLVIDAVSGAVLEYDTAGAFVRTFISSGSGGLTLPQGFVFGPDGNLYISNGARSTRILRYDGHAGAFLNTFVSGGSGGALNLDGLVFGPNGNLFAADFTGGNVKDIMAAAAPSSKHSRPVPVRLRSSLRPSHSDPMGIFM